MGNASTPPQSTTLPEITPIKEDIASIPIENIQFTLAENLNLSSSSDSSSGSPRPLEVKPNQLEESLFSVYNTIPPIETDHQTLNQPTLHQCPFPRCTHGTPTREIGTDPIPELLHMPNYTTATAEPHQYMNIDFTYIQDDFPIIYAPFSEHSSTPVQDEPLSPDFNLILSDIIEE